MFILQSIRCTLFFSSRMRVYTPWKTNMAIRNLSRSKHHTTWRRYRNIVQYVHRIFIEVRELHGFFPEALRLLRWAFHYISAYHGLASNHTIQSCQFFLNSDTVSQEVSQMAAWQHPMAAYYWPAFKQLNYLLKFFKMQQVSFSSGFRGRRNFMLSW